MSLSLRKKKDKGKKEGQLDTVEHSALTRMIDSVRHKMGLPPSPKSARSSVVYANIDSIPLPPAPAPAAAAAVAAAAAAPTAPLPAAAAGETPSPPPVAAPTAPLVASGAASASVIPQYDVHLYGELDPIAVPVLPTSTSLAPPPLAPLPAGRAASGTLLMPPSPTPAAAAAASPTPVTSTPATPALGQSSTAPLSSFHSEARVSPAQRETEKEMLSRTRAITVALLPPALGVKDHNAARHSLQAGRASFDDTPFSPPPTPPNLYLTSEEVASRTPRDKLPSIPRSKMASSDLGYYDSIESDEEAEHFVKKKSSQPRGPPRLVQWDLPETSMGLELLASTLGDHDLVNAGGVVYSQRELYLRAIHCDPGFAQAYVGLATCLTERECITVTEGCRMNAIELCLHAISLSPFHAYFYTRLASFVPRGESVALPNGRRVDRKGLLLCALEVDANCIEALQGLTKLLLPSESVTLPIDGKQVPFSLVQLRERVSFVKREALVDAV